MNDPEKSEVAPPSELPIPFYMVLREELKLLKPDSGIEVNPLPGWGIDDKQLIAESGLKDKWYAWDLPTVYQEACDKDLDGRAIIDHLDDLIKSEKCLYHCKHFPKEKISPTILPLVKLGCVSVRPGERSGRQKDDLQHLNRLLLEQLFPDEIEKIYDIRLKSTYAQIHGWKTGLSALCLSGGGIRSATFALGILQGLVKKDLLGKFDYLSTVSGGGFIGGWLSSWLYRKQDPKTVFADMINEKPESPLNAEPKEIYHLRAYSNYLAPRSGLFSADTWVLIATYARNLFLNWLVFIPILIVGCTVPHVLAAWFLTPAGPFCMTLLLWGGLTAAVWSVAYASSAHPGAMAPSQTGAGGKAGRAKELIRYGGQGAFLGWCLLPLLISSILITIFWLNYYRYPGYTNLLILFSTDKGPNIGNYMLLGAAVHGLGWLFAQVRIGVNAGKYIRPRGPLFEIGSGVVGGVLLYLVAQLIYSRMFSLIPATVESLRPILYECFAPPVFLCVFLAAFAFFIGLTSYGSTDEDREWTARMGAWILIALVGWAGFNFLILAGPVLFYRMPTIMKCVSAAGGGSGILTLWLGYSSKTDANNSGGEKVKTSSRFSDLVLAVAAPVFLAAILVALSLLSVFLIYAILTEWTRWNRVIPGEGVLPWTLGSEQGYLAILQETPTPVLLLFFFGMLGCGVLMSWLINLNKFSLHSVYRNRLIRAYLGATNRARKANHFTGFDPADNIPMGDLEKGSDGLVQRPFHIVNMALNLVGGKNLAWQQRKAETFTSSCLYTGSCRLGYRDTAEYAQFRKIPGLTLGTAMTVSGAAANSNMGYHSSPLVSFLLTLFNIRLGCWLGNPGPAGKDSFKMPAPRNPALYIAEEALGLSDDSRPFVFLSDGGHFENFGLYEMIMRRCKLIVVSDAGCDPECRLEDLGNAIRKIRADFGVKIEIDPFKIYSRNDWRYDKQEKEDVGTYCAVGKIDYSSVDGVKDNSANGIIIYIKPAICGREPKDVFNYKESSESFPHESTVDQFFNETQFESYRALGLYVMERLSQRMPKTGAGTFEEFVRSVKGYVRSIKS